MELSEIKQKNQELEEKVLEMFNQMIPQRKGFDMTKLTGLIDSDVMPGEERIDALIEIGEQDDLPFVEVRKKNGDVFDCLVVSLDENGLVLLEKDTDEHLYYQYRFDEILFHSKIALLSSMAEYILRF